MKNLEDYINNDDDMVDPLIKLAMIHYQFESIHPFYDGNGRTGRIINILYLVLKELIDTPILYLSKYIIRNKMEYYDLFKRTRETGNFEDWIIYMLVGIEEMAEEIVKGIEKDGLEAAVFNIRDNAVDNEYLASSEGVIIGTPTYLASSVWQIKKWLEDDSRAINLSGKLGFPYKGLDLLAIV